MAKPRLIAVCKCGQQLFDNHLGWQQMNTHANPPLHDWVFVADIIIVREINRAQR